MSDPLDNNHPATETGDGRGLDRSSTLTDRVRSLRLSNQVTAGRAPTNWFPWVLCLVLFVTAAVLGYRAFSARADSGKPPPPKGGPEGLADSGDVALESKGYIIPVHQIQVSPKVGGLVMELNFEEGDKVQEGKVLAVLEKVNYKSDFDHANAAVEVAKAAIKVAEANVKQAEANCQQAQANADQMHAKLAQAERDWSRAKTLGPSGAIANVDYDTARAVWLTSVANVHAADAAIAQAESARVQAEKSEVQAHCSLNVANADLDKARWNLDNCTVVAPVSGTILTKKAEKGNFVNPIAFNVSASLCDMADLSDLEVDLSIQERDIKQVSKGQKCRIVSEAYPDHKPYDGYVSRLMPTADRAKGAVPVRVKVQVPKEEEGTYLRPDMSVIVSFLKPGAGEVKK